MKIDKVVFSSSEAFSVFWNANARLWSRMGIEPVCLLFGTKANTDMTEEFGQVIEVPVSNRFPLLIQITWSKFWWPKTEPDKTWLVSDIDLLPLGPKFFADRIVDLPADRYVHFDADGITQLSGSIGWTGRGEITPSNMPANDGHPTNLPGHYHCARGDVLATALEQHGTMEEEIQRVVDCSFRNERGHREDDLIEQHGFWCAEENWSTKALRRSIEARKVEFTPFRILHGIHRITGERIDKSQYDDNIGYYFDSDRLARGEYADLHCARPFASCCTPDIVARRWAAIDKVLRVAGMSD